MTATQFMTQVIELAMLRSWKVFHVHDAQKSVAGFPGLILRRKKWRGSRQIAAELEVGKRKLTPEQQDWLEVFAGIGEAYCWRPEDFAEIQRILE